jgi:SNF2 family DNA or RNA helicase
VSRIKKRFDVREIKSSKDITDWNAGKIPVAVIHPASAGHGLKLQAGGSTLIWFGLTWSLELYQQTNARLWRQGQASGTVVIEHIITKRKYKSTTIVFLDTRKTRTATSSSIQNRQKS